MLRAFIPVLLFALAITPSATPSGQGVRSTTQAVRSTQPVKPEPNAHRPPAGVRSVKVPAIGGSESLWDAERIAAFRARLERAKASGKITRERLVRQEDRLARLEAQLRSSGGGRSAGGVHAAGTIGQR